MAMRDLNLEAFQLWRFVFDWRWVDGCRFAVEQATSFGNGTALDSIISTVPIDLCHHYLQA